MFRYLVVFLSLLILTACGTRHTTVILLPEDNGKTGSVLIESQDSSTQLDKPYTSSTSTDAGFVVRETNQEEVRQTYEALLKAEPPKPVLFLLYFEYDSTQLTKASRELLPKVIQSAKDREPSEISIIGHTDTPGKQQYNNRLSQERAREVSKILSQHDTGLIKISVHGYGEQDLLIPTADNVHEARNRRVEIMIR
jgi:outer membrane protein OmpA-like peptidoglycan-associated protein